MEIPETWQLRPMTEVADFINGFPFKPSDWKKRGLPIVRIQNLNDPRAEFNYFDGEIDETYVVDNEDLLLSWSASLGVYVWRRGTAVINQHIFKVLPRSSIDKRFLYYVAHKAIADLKKRVHGSTMTHFKREELDATLIPIPPLLEQERIASILSTVDDSIQKTDEIITETQRLKNGLTQHLMEKGIAHTESEQTEIGEVPKGWQLVECEKLCHEITVGIVVTPAKYYVDSGVSCLRSFNILENAIDETDLVYISQEANKLHSKSILHAGDVVTVRTGKPGISCVVPESLEGTNCVDLIILRPDDRVESEFLSRFLNSENARRQILSWQGGSMQQHLNITMIKQLRVPIPEKDEQEKIVEVLTTVEGKLRQEGVRKTQLQRLKTGMMQALLTGRVRVGVD